MRVLIVGASGFVGSALYALFGSEAVGTYCTHPVPGLRQLDVRDAGAAVARRTQCGEGVCPACHALAGAATGAGVDEATGSAGRADRLGEGALAGAPESIARQRGLCQREKLRGNVRRAWVGPVRVRSEDAPGDLRGRDNGELG